MEGNKIRAKVNKRENRKKIQKINKTQKWFFETILPPKKQKLKQLY